MKRKVEDATSDTKNISPFLKKQRLRSTKLKSPSAGRIGRRKSHEPCSNNHVVIVKVAPTKAYSYSFDIG